MATHARNIRLRPATYEALEVEAARRHVPPDELADELVRGQLVAARPRSGSMGDALAALEELGARMPEVDAARLVREGRDELDRRSSQWPSS